MSKYALTISYIGTAYAGWQIQQNAPSVQGVMCDACSRAFDCKVSVTGCSRTDSGVHANEYLCVLDFEGKHNNIPAERLPLALNALLPNDISVLNCEMADDNFHPRYSTYGKEYVYKIYNNAIRNPFWHNRAYLYPIPLDIETMNKAANLFCGEHNFCAFMATGSKIENTVRTIYSARVYKDADTVNFAVSGNGFLYNMVRIMAGTLIDVGKGKISANDIPKIINSKSREKAGNTLPACGLYLNKILKERPI